jgi:outer membrane protein OmpA-like peptidoglycan-associated protein
MSMQFAWNSFVLTAVAQRELSKVRSAVTHSANVTISGYCDNDPVSVGNAYDVWLSRMRALAVADFLYSGHVPRKVKLVGHGRTDFVATNSTAVGRAENRRVTITFQS